MARPVIPKPHPWSLRPALAAPEWSWFWRHATAVFPFWDRQGGELITGAVPGTSLGAMQLTSHGRGLIDTDERTEFSQADVLRRCDWGGNMKWSIFVHGWCSGDSASDHRWIAADPGAFDGGDFHMRPTIGGDVVLAFNDGAANSFINSGTALSYPAFVTAAFVRPLGGTWRVHVNDGAPTTEAEVGAKPANTGGLLSFHTLTSGTNGAQSSSVLLAVYVFRGHELTRDQYRRLRADPFGPLRLPHRTAWPKPYSKSTQLLYRPLVPKSGMMGSNG